MVSGKRLRKRLSVGCALLVLAGMSFAMPIRPNLKTILAEPQQHPMEFPLARAGWNGPESAHASPATGNAAFAEFGPDAAPLQVRHSLRTAFVPDYRALAAIALVVLLLRRIRRARLKAEGAAIAASAASSPALVENIAENDDDHDARPGDAGLPPPTNAARAAGSRLRRAA